MTERLKPLWVLVETFEGDNDFPEMERTIDHTDYLHRQWLGKHCYWAMRNGRSVRITPVGEDK